MWPQGRYPWWEFTLVGILVCMPVIVFAASDIGRRIFLAFIGSIFFAIGWPIAVVSALLEKLQRCARPTRTLTAKPRPLPHRPHEAADPRTGEGRAPLLLQNWDASPRASLGSGRPQCLVDLGPPLQTPPTARSARSEALSHLSPDLRRSVSSANSGFVEEIPPSSRISSALSSAELRRANGGRRGEEDVFAIPEAVFETALEMANPGFIETEIGDRVL